jgi:hypothetical protein
MPVHLLAQLVEGTRHMPLGMAHEQADPAVST